MQLTLTARVGLRLPLSDDLQLIQQWLEMADVIPSWGNAEQNQRLLSAARGAIEHRVITVSGDAVGYLRWRTRAGVELRGTSVADALHDDAVRLDVLIGPRERRFVGIGSIALRLAYDELFATLQPAVCFGRASVDHLAVRRSYEKAGFLHHYFYDDPGIGPAVAMLRHAK